jgi:hypothetical protein
MADTKSKAIKDLRPGDVVQLASGNCATVKRAYRETLFEGNVWTVEHSQGQDTASGLDRVAILQNAQEADHG